MSEVNASDLRLIKSIDDVIGTYAGAGTGAKTGVEVELAFFDPKSPDLTPMTIAQNKTVKDTTNTECCGDFVRNEPTSEMLEVGSIPGGPDELRTILDDTNKKITCLNAKAANIDLKRSYFQHLPDKTANQLLQNVMDVERYQAFFAPPREDMQAIAAYFSVCKSNQVSVSYRGPDHLLENIRRLYVLAPFLFMITDNAAPFNEGKPFTGHAGMHHRAALEGRGGVPPYVFTARTGEEYIRNHIDHVMNNPLFVYYNKNGELIRLPSGTWTSFNKLREENLNTATNYFFAESILWPDVKIAALKDADNQVTGHRYEARMFGVGIHQHQTALLLTAALAFDAEFANQIDALLSNTGFDQTTPESLKAPLENAYNAARNHAGRFLNIAYGTTTMQKFASAFADLLENSEFLQTFSEELAPLLTICRTGQTDSHVNARHFMTLESALDFQRNYDPEIFENPNLCAHMLFEKKLRQLDDKKIPNCASNS
ncbi:MAG: hypothetical protein KDI11_04350 [Alphaproteobacteria bacterium]|nr:hypothetical protein [Alphaproteobacteria bacterium]